MAFSSNFLIPLQSLMALMCLVLIINTPVESKVCGEIDARNDPQSLEALRGCHIVLGSVSIVLIEKYHHSFDINNVSFPELRYSNLLTALKPFLEWYYSIAQFNCREITGYLLFFRVFKLESMQKLFPNLAVIRGERLLLHYALIIYEMPDLKEVKPSFFSSFESCFQWLSFTFISPTFFIS